jgi:hypothetical protein
MNVLRLFEGVVWGLGVLGILWFVVTTIINLWIRNSLAKRLENMNFVRISFDLSDVLFDWKGNLVVTGFAYLKAQNIRDPVHFKISLKNAELATGKLELYMAGKEYILKDANGRLLGQCNGG